MGFIQYRTERIELGQSDTGPWWVDIQELSQGRSSMVEGTLARGVQANPNNATATVGEGTVGRWRVEQVAQSIVDWNLTDENNVRLPVRPIDDLRKALNSLPLWAFNKIHAATEAINTSVAESEEDATFPDATERDTSGVHAESTDAPRLEGVSSETVVQDGAGDVI